MMGTEYSICFCCALSPTGLGLQFKFLYQHFTLWIQTGGKAPCLAAFLVGLFILGIGDSVSINSLVLCFLAVVASFRVHFTAENVRVFMLLYKGI
jgi:hypothetical protein